MKYILTIKLDNETIRALNKNDFSLCSFLACESPSYNDAVSLCWNMVKSFKQSNEVSWNDDYVAYFCDSKIKDLSTIYIPQPSNLALVSGTTLNILNQQKMIIHKNHTASIKSNIGANFIQINNKTETEFTSGLGVVDEHKIYNGICAFSLYGKNSLITKPVNKIFLMITPNVFMKVNTVVKRTTQIGILIDLQHSTNNQRTVSAKQTTHYKLLHV